MRMIKMGFLLLASAFFFACSQQSSMPGVVKTSSTVATVALVAATKELPAAVDPSLTPSQSATTQITTATTPTPLFLTPTGVVASPQPVHSTTLPPSPSLSLSPEGISNTLQICEETGHFILYCFEDDRAVSADLVSQLERHYEQITSHLSHEPKGKSVVEIYPDLQSFHLAVGRPNGPDWFVGKAESGKIKMVTPLNPGPEHTFEGILQVVIHEFTHLVVDTMTASEIPTWLDEGIALYEAEQSPVPQVVASQAETAFPNIADLHFNSGTDTGIVYAFSYTVVEFIVQEYGYDYLVKLVTAAGDFEAVFNLSETEFQQAWREFVMSEYVSIQNN